MKATGIVRRVDDLGRIVIPKEIRRTLKIREGDPLEIYTEKDGGVIFASIRQWENCRILLPRSVNPLEQIRAVSQRYLTGTVSLPCPVRPGGN